MRAAFWLFLGVFSCSTAVILIKKSALDPALLSALRLLLAALLLSPLFWRARARHREYWRGLTPLIYHHVNPYGRIELDMAHRSLLVA